MGLRMTSTVENDLGYGRTAEPEEEQHHGRTRTTTLVTQQNYVIQEDHSV